MREYSDFKKWAAECEKRGFGGPTEIPGAPPGSKRFHNGPAAAPPCGMVRTITE
jgi:hypothetical protein